jgi:hypothetical protein
MENHSCNKLHSGPQRNSYSLTYPNQSEALTGANPYTVIRWVCLFGVLAQ